ncbi:MAG: hypothetical protein MRY21_00425 [Simkaniaceae bacterium]|nr:hypothetical protein [Simkaniaceae bacterium]
MKFLVLAMPLIAVLIGFQSPFISRAIADEEEEERKGSRYKSTLCDNKEVDKDRLIN